VVSESARGRVYGPGVFESLAEVQIILDAHVGASGGRCAVCGPGAGVCQPYLRASRAFAWSGHLPRRRPGLTRPELAGARLVAVGGFDAR
jgi:hypothetical protein